MKQFYYHKLLLLTLIMTSPLLGYTNLSPLEVHNKLVQGDTLLLLDVREVSEYNNSHIAESPGQLPQTPINMPWNSNVLSEHYALLPQNIDIIVYCSFGSRSASASNFLENKGFTKIFSMTGGFNSWNYESRKNGFGNHSGEWVSKTDTDPVIITCSETGGISKIRFLPEALPIPDSAYLELHFASLKTPVPDEIPGSDILGLFRITALDRYGLSLFQGDSLVLTDTIDIELIPLYPEEENLLSKPSINENMSVFIPGQGWQNISFEYEEYTFYHRTTVLHRWMNVEGYGYSDIERAINPNNFEICAYPNPFNGTIHISAPEHSEIKIIDIHGKLIKSCETHTWTPEYIVPSGIYFINVQTKFQDVITKVIYLK